MDVRSRVTVDWLAPVRLGTPGASLDEWTRGPGRRGGVAHTSRLDERRGAEQPVAATAPRLTGRRSRRSAGRADGAAGAALGPYDGPVDHVRWRTDPTLDRPVLVAAFEGWNDAGDAASGAVRYLIDRYDAELVAEIDPEEFFDFTSTRPQAELDDDGVRQIVWPSTEVYAATLPGRRRRRPPARRHRAAAPLADVLRARSPASPRRLGCRLVVTLGALVAEVPHSRPGAGRRHGARPELCRPSWACSRRPTRGPPASSACCTPPAARPACPRRRCGRRCPPTCPPRRRPRRRWRCSSSTAEVLGRRGCPPPTSRSRPPPTSARSASWSQEDDETSDYVTQLEERHDSDERRRRPARPGRWSKRSSATSATARTDRARPSAGRTAGVARPGPGLLPDAGQAQRDLVAVAAGHDLQADGQAVGGRARRAPTRPGSSTGWPAW